MVDQVGCTIANPLPMDVLRHLLLAVRDLRLADRATSSPHRESKAASAHREMRRAATAVQDKISEVAGVVNALGAASEAVVGSPSVPLKSDLPSRIRAALSDVRALARPFLAGV